MVRKKALRLRARVSNKKMHKQQ